MKLIEKIEISYFRSFSKTEAVDQCSDLNILSGRNDSGKSNVLRALNLFFTENKVDFYNYLNFKKDFSKYREKVVTSDQIKGKKVFKIRILFNRKQFSWSILPDKFWIEKIWDKDGNITRKTKNKNNSNLKREDRQKEWKDPKVEASTTQFLKKIYFFYIPAIKSKIFFDHLKWEYQKSLGNAIDKLSKIDKTEKKTLENWKEILNTWDIRELLGGKINSEAKKMMEKFQESASEISESSLTIPSLDFSKVLEIETENNISLDYRGDGIQAKFIPHILNEISKNNRSQLVIWWFEEPENSYEYINAQKLADEFVEDFSKDKQIFITSHSFNFITLSWEGISKYRVRKDNNDFSNITLLPNKKEELEKKMFTLNEDENKDRLFEELGIPLLSEELKKLYKQKEEELKNLNKIKKSLQNDNKICLLTEGKNDVSYLTIFLDKYLSDWREEYKFIDQEHGQNTSASALSNLLISLSATSPSIKFIWIFDNDHAGYTEYDKLIWKNLHNNVKYMILPELEWAKEWQVKLINLDDKELVIDINKKALSIEMYFWHLFESDFTNEEKTFEFIQTPTLPNLIKKKLQEKINTLNWNENMIDGKKIIDNIKSIQFD
jgi:hypothetical protein